MCIRDSYYAKSAYLCAAKCYLRASKYDEAKKAFEMSKGFEIADTVQDQRPIISVDDSKAIVLKLENHLENLGYTNIHSASNGNEALKVVKKLLKQNPIVLLDMGLPDITGDVVASKILQEKPDTQIILITADEKTAKRVKDTISSGVVAFIQKPFTISELRDALQTAESEYAMLEK